MRILVAEDDRATRTRIMAFLREWGHEGVAAANGTEAWELAQQGDLDLIVTDWQMPGMDGLELLKRIRERAGDRRNYLYAILLTSRSEKSDLVEGMNSGADDFVSKPFDKDELRVRIQAAQRIVELEKALSDRNRQLQATNEVISAANLRMSESLEAAARIQQAFLPEDPPDSLLAKFAWIYEPCDELAGDTLNIVPFDEHRVALYILDVSGHGVPAALLSVHLSRLLTHYEGADSLLCRTVESDGGIGITPPLEVVKDLNHRFTLDDEIEQYFTAVYGVLDLRSREFRYTSAGHPGPLVISGGKGQRHRARPPAVGFLQAARFTEETLACQAGDRLYFYTDGIFEVANASGEELGEERLVKLLESGTDLPLQASLELVRDAARSWSGGNAFVDDVSLIGVEIS